jgi:predicted nucleic acid-binding protein
VVLVDSNVLLDVFEEDVEWSDWSQERLDSASAVDTLVINPVIYSEISIGFAHIEELETIIEEASLVIENIPREALFLAGKAYLRYRRGGGTKHSVLPDFYIGAHAAVMGWPLLTRDVGRYRTHFPTVSLIAP